MGPPGDRGCSHSRTPVDEVLGKPFQDSMLDVINSFFKSGLPAAQRAHSANAGAPPDGDEEEDEFEEEVHEGGGPAKQESSNDDMIP